MLRGGVESIGWQMPRGLPETAGVARCKGEVEPGLPDRQVVRQPLEAAIEPVGRRGEPAGQDGTIRSAQPDSVVSVIGAVEGTFPRFDWHGRVIE